VSDFSVGGTQVSFDAIDASFSDKGNALEEVTCSILVNSSSDWGALFSLRSWNVNVRPIPGSNTIYVDIGGIEPSTLRRRARATWLMTN
jgi:hypothetical protein